MFKIRKIKRPQVDGTRLIWIFMRVFFAVITEILILLI